MKLCIAYSEYDAEGCAGHMELTIQSIETGSGLCPKPRKTYEYAALAKALNCTVDELID